MVDATADGRADYCRLSAGRALCTAPAGAAFGATFASGRARPGRRHRARLGRLQRRRHGGLLPRARVDARLLALDRQRLRGDGPSFPLDAGFAEGRAWADVNGDGRADYCRRIGSATNTLVRCTLATGAGFGSEVTSGRIEWGAEEGTAWVDFEGDGDRDFCRPIGASVTTAQLFCTLWPGLGAHRHLLARRPRLRDRRAWVDHNGDGKADYCRRVGDAPEQQAHLLHDLQRHRLRPAAVRAARADPHPDAEPRAARRATRRAAEADRDLPALGQELEPHVDAFMYLRVTDVPRGATVSARCPKGCSRKTYTKRNARGTVSLKRLVRKRLKVGTTITVTVTGPARSARSRCSRSGRARTRRSGPAASHPGQSARRPAENGRAQPLEVEVPVHLEVYWIDGLSCWPVHLQVY